MMESRNVLGFWSRGESFHRRFHWGSLTVVHEACRSILAGTRGPHEAATSSKEITVVSNTRQYWVFKVLPPIQVGVLCPDKQIVRKSQTRKRKPPFEGGRRFTTKLLRSILRGLLLGLGLLLLGRIFHHCVLLLFHEEHQPHCKTYNENGYKNKHRSIINLCIALGPFFVLFYFPLLEFFCQPHSKIIDGACAHHHYHLSPFEIFAKIVVYVVECGNPNH